MKRTILVLAAEVMMGAACFGHASADETIVHHKPTAYTAKTVKKEAPHVPTAVLAEELPQDTMAENQKPASKETGQNESSREEGDIVRVMLADAKDESKPNPHVNAAVQDGYPYEESVSYAEVGTGGYAVILRRQSAQVPEVSTAQIYSLIILAEEGSAGGSFDDKNLPGLEIWRGDNKQRITFKSPLALYPQAVMLRLERDTLGSDLSEADIIVKIPGAADILLTKDASRQWESVLRPAKFKE